MVVTKEYQADLDALVARRHDNGGDFWATADGRWGTGSPFSTFDCLLMLHELGVARTDPLVKGAANAILATWREDGRFRAAPRSTMYPCHTANAVRALCRAGFARNRRVRQSFEWLLDEQHVDGGWRCSTVKLGTSLATDASNPGVTLSALDGFRFSPYLNESRRLDRAVKTLLAHWKTRVPLGPCQFGIGSRFARTEFPFLRYNLFFYVYVLSFYDAAKGRREFKQAVKELEAKLDGGKMVVESPNRGLAKLALCRKGEPSRAATKRWKEIRRNLET